MIIRIVRMAFRQDQASTFLDLFNEHKVAIRSFKGCTHLELLNDVNDTSVFTTYSIWEVDTDLEEYRKSTLFKEVWSKVKPMFSGQPQAFTLTKIIEL
jgi:quinol monooxygenase YgiN